MRSSCGYRERDERISLQGEQYQLPGSKADDERPLERGRPVLFVQRPPETVKKKVDFEDGARGLSSIIGLESWERTNTATLAPVNGGHGAELGTG